VQTTDFDTYSAKLVNSDILLFSVQIDRQSLILLITLFLIEHF